MIREFLRVVDHLKSKSTQLNCKTTRIILYTRIKISTLSTVGAFMGEQGCLLKLACLSGKRAASVTGATTAAMLLSSAHSMMPEAVKEPYQVGSDF